MPLLLNHTHPQLNIYNPFTGGFRQFRDGSLVIEEGDPDYEVVMAEAIRNPYITIYETVGTCPVCGQVVGKGQTAAASVQRHLNDAHPEADEQEAVATSNRQVKSRAIWSCDVCRPAQTFEDEEGLQAHNKLIHMGAPTLDSEGNTVDEGAAPRRRRPGEAGIPAATRK